ncbi:hypothetical protein [Streptomyces sp. Wb2n-11]|uniref:hypothetical protein n=1 Tax=Streptomyces sp. Wb2n-11 TaxID=1030533 RepID=UPI000A537202|nr:hypothetical protein [Streptomyces sp. Wb2n-11]
MSGRPGRGRPAVFDEGRREKYLAAITGGMKAHEAAVRAGVSRNIPAQYAKTDSAFAAALALAKKKGRAQRLDDMPHNVSRYVNYGCRCPTCRADATKKRAASPDRKPKARPAPAPTPASHEVIHMPKPAPQTPTSLPLLLVRAS